MQREHPHINFASFTFSRGSHEPASPYIRPEYHRYVAPGQVTVHRSADYWTVPVPRHPGDDILTTEGRNLLAELRRRAVEERPKAVIEGKFARTRTGAVIFPGVGGCLCTFNNLVLRGRVLDSATRPETIGGPFQTSTIVMYDVDADYRLGFVVTESGSLYKYVAETDSDDDDVTPIKA